MPARPGPRRAHKLTEEIVGFARAAREADPDLRPPDLAALIAERFGLSVHPRSAERALARVRQARREDRTTHERQRYPESRNSMVRS